MTNEVQESWSSVKESLEPLVMFLADKAWKERLIEVLTNYYHDGFDATDLSDEELAEKAEQFIDEYGLEFSWEEKEQQEPYFRYLLGCGGPRTEFRFYAGYNGRLHKAQFWYVDGRKIDFVDVTNVEWVARLWQRLTMDGDRNYLESLIRQNQR